METEKILNKIFAELEKEAYDKEYHVYNYKRTNQIIRANIEALMQASFISSKQDVIKAVCDCVYPISGTSIYKCGRCGLDIKRK